MAHAWDYTPREGVFRVDIGSVHQGTILRAEYDSLDVAIATWAELTLPVQEGWLARVVDSRLAGILTYCANDRYSADLFPEGIWGGCAVGFEALAATGLAHPVDLAVWESIART